MKLINKIRFNSDSNRWHFCYNFSNLNCSVIEKVSIKDESIKLRLKFYFKNARMEFSLKNQILFEQPLLRQATEEDRNGLFYMAVRKSSLVRTQPFDLIRFDQIKSENSNSFVFNKLYIVVLIVAVLVSISLSTFNKNCTQKARSFPNLKLQVHIYKIV